MATRTVVEQVLEEEPQQQPTQQQQPSQSKGVGEDDKPASPSVTIKLRKPKPKLTKKVSFTEDTVDNEELGRKKSKCCCIYEKPKEFAESSESESEAECEHCSGHVEAKHRQSLRRSPSPPPPVPDSLDEGPEGGEDDEEEGKGDGDGRRATGGE